MRSAIMHMGRDAIESGYPIRYHMDHPMTRAVESSRVDPPDLGQRLLLCILLKLKAFRKPDKPAVSGASDW
jgi:hypothetical protein